MSPKGGLPSSAFLSEDDRSRQDARLALAKIVSLHARLGKPAGSKMTATIAPQESVVTIGGGSACPAAELAWGKPPIGPMMRIGQFRPGSFAGIGKHGVRNASSQEHPPVLATFRNSFGRPSGLSPELATTSIGPKSLLRRR
jgi:hypothetical protein